MSVVAEHPMAKPKTEGPVRIDPEVLRLARVVVAFENIGLGDYLSDVLRPTVEADYARLVKAAAKRHEDKPPKR